MKKLTPEEIKALPETDLVQYFSDQVAYTRTMVRLIERVTENMPELKKREYDGIAALVQGFEEVKALDAELFEAAYGEEYQTLLRILAEKKPKTGLPSA